MREPRKELREGAMISVLGSGAGGGLGSVGGGVRSGKGMGMSSGAGAISVCWLRSSSKRPMMWDHQASSSSDWVVRSCSCSGVRRGLRRAPYSAREIAGPRERALPWRPMG